MMSPASHHIGELEEIDHAATFQQGQTGALPIGNAVFYQNKEGNFSNDADETPRPPLTTAQFAARSTAIFESFFVALSLLASASGCGEQHADTSEHTDTREPTLENTFESPEAVSRALLAALEAQDHETLRRYALSEEEFRFIVWPELPASRPGRNVPLSYAWGDLNQKATNCLCALLFGRGGRHYELVRVEFEGETTPYETFKVHRDARLVDSRPGRQSGKGELLRLDHRAPRAL